MRVLALDHHFSHDLASMADAKRDGDVFLVLRYSYLRRRFLKLFPPEVLGTDFSLYSAPAYDGARKCWAAWSRDEARTLLQLWSPDVFVLPSDTFPYVRELVGAFQALGLPVLVVQKETTIAPDTMEHHSRSIGEHLPFIADHMTVCSEHHRQFWLKAGADPDKVSVTGQPRFDCYGAPAPTSGCDQGANGDILLFSFMTDAYVPIRRADRHVWRGLLTDIEAALIRQAMKAGKRLLIKPHPQQPAAQLKECVRRMQGHDPSGRHWVLLAGDADARQLIRQAAVVVGFQTTALMEGCLAGKPTIYCCWGEAYAELASGLIPYEGAGEGLGVAHSPDELETAILEALGSSQPAPVPPMVRDMLGVCDGHASKRVHGAMSDLIRTKRQARANGRMVCGEPHATGLSVRKAMSLAAGEYLAWIWKWTQSPATQAWSKCNRRDSTRLALGLLHRARGREDAAVFERAYR